MRKRKSSSGAVERSSHRGDFWVRDWSTGRARRPAVRPRRFACAPRAVPPPRAPARRLLGARPRARAGGSPARGPRASRSAVLRALEREPRASSRAEPGRRTGGMDARSNRARFACLRLRGAVGRATRRTAVFSRRGGTDTSGGRRVRFRLERIRIFARTRAEHLAAPTFSTRSRRRFGSLWCKICNIREETARLASVCEP
jgi:hypothetical protein